MSTPCKRPQTESSVSDEGGPSRKVARWEDLEVSSGYAAASSTFSAIGTSGTVAMVAGNFINGDYNVVQEGERGLRDRVKGIQDDQKKEKIEKWMAAPDTSLNYKAAREKHQRGTGSWFVGGPDFKNWKDGPPGSVLWLRGGRELFFLERPWHSYTCTLQLDAERPYCGEYRSFLFYEGSYKSFNSSSAMENVKDSCRGKPSVGYAYFFFDGTSAQSKLANHESMVRSIIMQLSRRFDGIPPALVELYEDEDNGCSQPVLSSLEDTLLQILQSFGAAYIVIDALDECEERPKLLRWMDSVTSQTSGFLHLMVTSRPEPDIKDRLRPLCNLCEVDVADRRDLDDIRRYIDASLSEVHAWTDSQKELVRIALVNGADGVFRWVALMIHQLLSDQCLSTSELKIRLKSLPKGLDEAYTKIIQQCTRRADVIRLLQWIIFGQQGFTAQQLAEVAAINFDAGDDTLPFYDPDRRYGSPDSVLRACSGLVIEVQVHIKIAHFSVKEFLLSKVIQLEATRSIRFNESHSHQAIAKTCLAYLQFGELDSITGENIESFPLAFYAAEHCVNHVESICGEDLDATLEQMIQQLALPVVSCALINWYRLEGGRMRSRRPTLKSHIKLWDVEPALYAAIVIPLTRLVHHLIKNGKRGVALDVTSDLGSLAIAKLLLEKGADANATRGEYGIALQAASHRGYLEIARLLLEKGADVNATGGLYGTALQAASYGGYFEIARLLLENGADVDATGGEYGTTLYVASYLGHLKIARLLLENGADVDATGGTYGTALQAASFMGQLETARLLLEKGADVDATSGHYSTALQAASYLGHLEIARLLLEKGAHVNATGGQYGTALQAASYMGHLEIARQLLENGADVDATGGQYGTALQAASVQGRLKVTQLLLENGADVNITGGEYGTALQAAAYGEQFEIVKLLLEKGAEINATGGKRGSALQAARDTYIGRRAEAIVQLLKEHGALEMEPDVESDKTLAFVNVGADSTSIQRFRAGSYSDYSGREPLGPFRLASSWAKRSDLSRSSLGYHVIECVVGFVIAPGIGFPVAFGHPLLSAGSSADNTESLIGFRGGINHVGYNHARIYHARHRVLPRQY
ncbi:hypothetical protein HWV62_7932 [Athelia sp. TMB]|nr:hypothetical protein HWV62_7932 [Athelia sp. TMB]